MGDVCTQPGYGCHVHYCCHHGTTGDIYCTERCYDDETCSHTSGTQWPRCMAGYVWGFPGRGPCPDSDIGGYCTNASRACCLRTGECVMLPWRFCEEQGGTVIPHALRCENGTCPDPKPCCLCRQQCVMVPFNTCKAYGGLGAGTQDCQFAHCELHDVKRACHYSRFVVTPDDDDDNADRYYVASVEMLEPHEYVRGPVAANCRHWRASVSAEHGAWTCWQPDIQDGTTKRFTRLKVDIQPGTGYGRLWADYRPVCPEYS